MGTLGRGRNAVKCFVFGSNLAGRHGAGAALHARKYFGARYGVGEGPQGNSYAIPTKDAELRTLALAEIEIGVAKFLAYARANPTLQFKVTAIGCGLAGYKPGQIAPMFADAPSNCELPDEFICDMGERANGCQAAGPGRDVRQSNSRDRHGHR